jgi:hypothetical protein
VAIVLAIAVVVVVVVAAVVVTLLAVVVVVVVVVMVVVVAAASDGLLQGLTLQTCVREVLGSNFGGTPAILTEVFVIFLILSRNMVV